MPDISKMIEEYNQKQINPETGREDTNSPKGEPTFKLSTKGLALSYRDPLTTAVPITDLQQFLPDKSQYDKQLTGRDILNTLDDPQLLTDMRAGKQTGADAFGNAMLKFGAKTGVNVVGNIVGGMYGLGSFLRESAIKREWSPEKLWDNAVINETMKWSEELDKSHPVYKDREYHDKNFFQAIGNFGMFLDETSDAVAFTAGAVLSAYITAGLATPLRLANVINRSNRVIKGFDAITKVPKAQQALMLTDDILGNARRVYTSFNYEAAVEAAGAGKEMMAKIEADVNQKYAKLNEELDNTPGIFGNIKLPGEKEIINPDDREAKRAELKKQYDEELQTRLSEAKEQINKAQLGVYLSNAALLYFTSAFQFSNTFGVRWNNAIVPRTNVIPKGAINVVKNAAGELVEEGAEKAAKQGVKAVSDIIPKTKFGKAASNVWTFIKNPIAEGIVEEGGQGIFSTGFQNYYGSRFDPEIFEEAKELAETFGDAVSEQFTTKEGWKEVLMGMMIGSMGAPGKGLLPGNLGIDEETGKRGKWWRGGIAGAFQERAAERERYTAEIANVNAGLVGFESVAHATANTFLATQAANKQKQEGIGKEDKFEFLHGRDDAFFAGMYARERAGLGDSHDTSIAEMENMTPDQFINSYSTNEADRQMTEEDKKAFQENTIQQIKDSTAKIRKSIKQINRVMPSDPIANYNPEIEEYKEQLSYIAYKGEALDYRYNQLLDFIEQNKGDASFTHQELDNVVKKLVTLNLGNRVEVERAVRAFAKSEELTQKITDELQRFTKESEETKAKIATREAVVKTLTEKIQPLQEELTNLDKELDLLRKDAAHNEKVKNDILEKEVEKSTLKDTLEQQASILKDKLNTLQTKLSQATTPAQERRVKKEIAAVEAPLNQLISQIEKVNSEIQEIRDNEAFGENWGMELLSEIDKKETIKVNTQKNIENLSIQLSKENKKIEELGEALKTAATKHIVNSKELEEASKKHKSNYKTILEANKLIAEEKSRNRGVKFQWDNFDDYVNEVIDAYNKSQGIYEQVNQLIKIDPLKSDEVFQAITDLARLEYARQESIEIMNYFLSKRGKDAFTAKIATVKKNLFDEHLIKVKDIENKVKTITSHEKYGNFADPTKGIPYSYEVGEGDNKQTIKGWIVEGKNEVPIFYTRDSSVVVDQEGDNKYNAVALSKLLKWEQDGIIKGLQELTPEAEQVVKDTIKLKKQTKVDRESGRISTITKTYENKETGEKYALVEKQNVKGEVYQEAHLVNDDGTIQPKPLPKYDTPDLSTLTEIASEEMEFEGELITLKDNRKDSKDKVVTALLTYESPFMFEGEAEHKSTYPTELRFKPLGGGSEIIIKDNSPEQAKKIIELIDMAQEANQSSEKKVAPGTNKPIITYNGQEGYIDYTIKEKKFFFKKSKKGKPYKKYYYTLPGKQSVRAVLTTLAEGVSQEELDNALLSGELNSRHLGNLIGSATNYSNYDINDIEVLQEDFLSKSGEHYVIFRDRDSKDGKIYAAKKVKVVYEYYEDSGQLSRRSVPIRAKDFKPRNSYQLVVREGEYEKIFDKNLDKEVGTGADPTIRLGAQIPTLSFVAGREVNYQEKTSDKGNVYLVDLYNDDGTLSKNSDPNQARWYNYFKTAFKTKEDVENFKKTHFLKIVLNTSPEWKRYFDPNDPNSNNGLDSNGNILENQFDNVTMKVVLVKRNDDGSFTEVTSEGQPLFNTIHTPEYKGFQARNEEERKHYQQEHRNLREKVLNYIIKEKAQGRTPSILFPIDSVSSGRAGREQDFKETTDQGVQTRRAKFPVIGRIVPEGTDPRTIPWEVVTKLPGTNSTIPTSLKVNGVEYLFTRPPGSVGSVLTAIKGANGEVIPVALLTRNLTTQEATTVAALLRMAIVDGKNEFKGLKIIPDTDESIKDAVFYLKRFVKYGSNNSENKATELYWNKSTKTLSVGTQKFTIDRIKTEEGFDSLIAAIQDTKIHHVSNQFTTDFAINYLDKQGNITETHTYNSYEEYLFGEGNRGNNPPILQTDVLKYGSPDSIVQVSVGFGNPVVGESDSALYETKPFEGRITKSTSKKSTNIDTGSTATAFPSNNVFPDNAPGQYGWGNPPTLSQVQAATPNEFGGVIIKTITTLFALKFTITGFNHISQSDYTSNPAKAYEFIIRYLAKHGVDMTYEHNNDNYLSLLALMLEKYGVEKFLKTGLVKLDDNKPATKEEIKEKVETVLNVQDSGADANDFITTPTETKPVEEKLTYTNEDLDDLLFSGDKTSKNNTDSKIKPRLTSLTNTTGEVIKENIEEVEAWFAKNLPNIPLHIKDNLISLVEGKAWGVFTGHVVNLYKLAEIGSGYHEGFHVVAGIGLSDRQRNMLWDIVKSETGSKNISYRQAEELLAEDYREWKLYGKSRFQDSDRKKLSLFKRISNFVDKIIAFINGETYIRDISDLYSKIDSGAFKHIKVKEGTKELSKDMWKPREWAGLSVIETEDLLTGITPIIIDNLYKNYNGDFSKLSTDINIIILNSLREILDIESSLPVEVKNKVTDGIKADKIGLMKNIQQHFEYIGMKMDIDANELDGNQETLADEFNLEESANKENTFADSNTISNLRNVSDEVKVILATLQEVDSNGAPMLNSMGLPKVLDASTAYVTALDYLSGTLDWDTLYSKLEELAKLKPEYQQVVERLNNLTGDSRLLIRNKFRQAMSINRYGYKTYLIGKDGGTFINSSVSRNTDRLKEEMDSSYKESQAYKNSKVNASKTNKEILDKIEELKLLEKSNFNLYSKKYKELADYLGIGNTLDVDSLLRNINNRNELLTALKDTFNSSDIVGDLTEITGGRIKSVLMHEAINRKDFYEPQVTTSANKTAYQFSLNNYYSTIKNIVNNATSVEDLFTKLPHLRKIEGKSMWLDQIIGDLIKGKNPSLNITFLEGMREDISGQEGEVAYDLSRPDLIKMHIEGMLLHDLFTLRRPSDKALEPAIEGVTINKEMFKDEDSKSNRLLNYIKYDLDSNNSKKLSVFDPILSDATKQLILSSPNQINSLRDKILAEYESYMKSKAESYAKYLIENGLIWVDKDSKIIANLFSDKIKAKYTTAGKFNLEQFSKDFAEMYFFKTIEQHMMFLGDFGQFKQLFKRTSGATGTGETFTNDKETIQYLQEGYLQQLRALSLEEIMDRTDLLLKLTESQRKEFADNITDFRSYEEYNPSTSTSVNISVLKDRVVNLRDLDKAQYDFIEGVIKNDLDKTNLSKEDKERLIASYMRPYLNMDIADGLGYITLDQYREWLHKSGKWRPEQEKSYQKIIKGEKLSFEDVAVFPVIKPQGFGPKNYTTSLDGEIGVGAIQDKSNKYNLAFEKLSLIPLIPGALVNTELESLMKSMQKSGVNIAINTTGFKNADFGTVNEFNGEEMFLDSFNQSDIFWKIQVQIHPEIEESDTDGTQQRVLTFLDMFDGGMPIDYKGTETQWNELTLDEQKKSSELKSLYTEYSEIYSELIEDSKEKFLKDSGIIQNAKGEYIVRDKVKFLANLRKEVNQRRLPTNILKALVLNEEGEFKFPLDALPIADKIENMLFAKAMNSTTRIKRPGAAYVQTSNALWTTKDDIKAKKYAERLKFIRRENGEIVGAEVYLPNYMKNIIGDVSEQDFDKLMKSNPELFQLMGYRIPTQGQNSMLPLVVKGFLPSEMGDTVIVPFEIVAQSGSDFDIDKLHIFRPAILADADGKPFIVNKNTSVDDIYKTVKNAIETIDNITGLTPIEGEQIESVLSTNIALASFGLTREEVLSQRGNLAKLTKSKIKTMQQQNRILEIQLNLLRREESLRNTLVPNGAESLKEDAAYKEFLTQETTSLIPEGSMASVFSKNSKEFKHFLANKKDVQTNSQLLDFAFEMETGMAFKGGKKGVAIAANYGKFHALAQQYGLYLRPSYYITKFTSDKGEIPSIQRVKVKVLLNYKHNSFMKEAASFIALGRRYAVNGSLISEGYGEHLTANVDIAKDPFIFKLNTNNITSGVKYFMLETGADPSWVNAFLTQPIIEEYVSKIVKNEALSIESTRNSKNSVYQSKYEIVKELLEKHGVKFENKSYTLEDLIIRARETKIYTKLELDKGVYYGNKEEKVDFFNEMQINVLGDFLDYLEYSKVYNDAVQAAKPDTLRLKNHAHTTATLDNIIDVINSEMIGNYENIFKDPTSILGGFSQNHAEFVSTLYNKLFITQSQGIQRDIFDVIKGDLKKSNTKLNEREMDKIRQSVITALLQTAINRSVLNSENYSPISREKFLELTVGDKSVAKELSRFKKSGALSKISEYLEDFIFSRIGKESDSVNYVKVSGKKIDPFTAERIAAEFEILRNSEPKLYNLLLAITVAQTGMVYSPINFTKHFDSDVISNIMLPVLKQVTASGVSSVLDLSNDVYSNFIDNFYSINRSNKKLVPKVRLSKSSGAYLANILDDNVLNLAPKNNNYGRRFIKRSILEGEGKDATWVDVLYRLEGYLKDTAVYVKINPKGNYMSQEYHTGDKSVNPDIATKSNTIETKTRESIIKEYLKEGVIAYDSPTPVINNAYTDAIARAQNVAMLNLLTYEDYKKNRDISFPLKSEQQFVEFKKELDKVKDLVEKNAMWNQFLQCK